MGRPLGLIAGDGRLPREIARAARAQGRRVVALAFRDVTDPAIDSEADRSLWLHLGELQAAFDYLHDEEVAEAVMAGKVAKANLFEDLEALHVDTRAAKLLGSLPDLRDDSILGALASALEAEGITVRPQLELVPDLIVEPGVLGRVHPTPQQWEDVVFGWTIAKALGGLDIGQSIVVKARAVLAVEAIEGTDAAILRGGKLGGPGGCIVKVAKPDQDPRFDLPAVGLETVESAVAARAEVLAFEAGRTVVLDRPELVARADAEGIAVVAVAAAGPDAGMSLRRRTGELD